MSQPQSDFISTLSASIWGPGWQQVEPLPASFDMALQHQQQLDKAASEKEAQLQAQQAIASLSSSSEQGLSKSKKKKLKKAAAAAAAAAAKTSDMAENASMEGGTADENTIGNDSGVNPSQNTLTDASSGAAISKTCNSLSSARLPRSLQFVA
ncbi:hypothetical protein BGZ94_010344 [Podila epigama]|nr:hypothetical protein BGZ94_010344 [Podila epigama]